MMNIPFSPPDMSVSEIHEVAQAIESGWITTGPKTKKFEAELARYAGTEKMACLSSATAAMEMVLRFLGIGPGDEVIVPAYTYTATCSVVCHVGARPVMVDCGKDSHEMDYHRLDSKITGKTKAIIPVDFGGVLCDYNAISDVLERNKGKYRPANEVQEKFYRPVVVADSAHGFGAIKDNKQSGQWADFTCFSFHAVKNLTTAEGGAVTWKSLAGMDGQWAYQQFMNLSLHGQTKDAFEKSKGGSWEYDILFPAYKCNMTDIQSSIGLAQLKRYPDMLKRRHQVISEYDKAFKKFDVQVLSHQSETHRSSGHLYVLRVGSISEETRNEIIVRLGERGIAANVHYKPLPMLTAYKNMGFHIEDYPHAYDFYRNEITLPLYSRLSEEQVAYIIEEAGHILGDYC
jgi:dTDP-4-amino-4,6-dideoxygalactose transaminase